MHVMSMCQRLNQEREVCHARVQESQAATRHSFEIESSESSQFTLLGLIVVRPSIHPSIRSIHPSAWRDDAM